MEQPIARNRVSLTAALSGSLITVAVMVLLMSTSGEWRSERGFFEPSLNASPGFWMSATMIAWLFSVALGSALAALIANSKSTFDGALQGLVVWAASYLFVGGLILTMMRPLPEFGEQLSMSKLIWSGFAGDILGLAISLLAGATGAMWGLRKSRTSSATRHNMSPAAFSHS